MEKRIDVLKTQRVFDPSIFENPGMVELIEYIKCQEWLHLFNLPILAVHKKEERDFYYTSKFFEDGLHVSAMVQGIDIYLDKTVLGEILDVPMEGIRSVKEKVPSLEFVQEVSKISKKSKVGVLKKYLKGEFQLLFQFLNKVLLPQSDIGTH